MPVAIHSLATNLRRNTNHVRRIQLPDVNCDMIQSIIDKAMIAYLFIAVLRRKLGTLFNLLSTRGITPGASAILTNGNLNCATIARDQ